MRTCASAECGKDFAPKTHNQRYCSDNCCRVATNKRIMENYYERKAIRAGAVRHCKMCPTKLSRYNDTKYCMPCTIKRTGYARKELLAIFDHEPTSKVT